MTRFAEADSGVPRVTFCMQVAGVVVRRGASIVRDGGVDNAELAGVSSRLQRRVRRAAKNRAILRIDQYRIAMTSRKHRTGTSKASSDSTVAPAVSAVLTTGLPRPAVATPVLARINALPVLVSPATLPPATIASGHMIAGAMSVMTDALTTMPATTAAGAAIKSRM